MELKQEDWSQRGIADMDFPILPISTLAKLERCFLEWSALQRCFGALTEALAPYSLVGWREPALLQRLTGFSWWAEAVGASGHQ
jgi:hypothetical protein